MNFKGHAVFHIKIQCNQLLVDAIGPLNEEIIKQYTDSLEFCIQVIEASP